MKPRMSLQTLLEGLPGVAKVYFQPPEDLVMVYPCIVYERDGEEIQHADNLPAVRDMRYSVTVIDRNADSPINEAMLKLPKCSLNRSFSSEKLHHDIYTIFF